MKNKAIKILTIISFIVLGLGIFCLFETNLLISKDNNFAILFTYFISLTFKLLIIYITAGIIAGIWLIYGIVVLIKKIKNGEVKWKHFGIVTFLLIIVVLLLLAFFSLFSLNNKYDYNIKYQDNMNTYNIYKINDKAKVIAEEQVMCIKDPCPTIKATKKINFSDNNMKIVNDFIKSFFKNNNYNTIQIFDDNLSEKQKVVLKSIIYNDENILNNDYSSKQYVIVTNSKYKTMQNDGGSNLNVYYEINLNNNIVKKYADKYIGFQGYEYKGKLLYEKHISNDMSKKMETLLYNLLSSTDVNDTNNYSPYKIKIGTKEKDIYNENSIYLLENILNKIDNQN